VGGRLGSQVIKGLLSQAKLLGLCPLASNVLQQFLSVDVGKVVFWESESDAEMMGLECW
jgi:hypothetical protein